MSSKSRKGRSGRNGVAKPNGAGAPGTGALNIKVGTSDDGKVAIAFDKAVSSFSLDPDGAINLARAIAAGAKKASEEREAALQRLAVELGPEKLRELAAGVEHQPEPPSPGTAAPSPEPETEPTGSTVSEPAAEPGSPPK